MSVVAMLQGTPDTDRATTLAALNLARKMNAQLTGLCALPDPNAAMMVVATPEATGFTASTTQSIIDMQEAILANSRQAFEDATGTGAHGLDCKFVHEVNTVERAAANAATLAEAVVYPRSATKAGEPLNISFEYVLMDAKLPVVLAPSGEATDGPVIIAWDGSNGAARAVRFHLPLIRAVGDVIIAQNEKDVGKDPKRDVASPQVLHDWLSYHRIPARVMDIEGEVASGLLAMAQGSGASMIVAGAFGHSRLAERIFGGTTRRMLTADDAPTLALAH